MERNDTSVSEFILLGLTNDAELQAVLFLFLLLIYVLSIMGNLSIIILTLLDYRFQSPIYFFLQNFSILEIFYCCLCSQNVSQCWNWRQDYLFCWLFHLLFCFLFFFAIPLGATEFYLLAAMSYDHYVAICKPLYYTTIMNRTLCIQLVLCSWFSGFLVVIVPHVMILQLSFCASNINHYHCDYTLVLYLTCLDTRLIEVIEFSLAVFMLIFTLILVILSYTYINRTILRIPSVQQRKKAFRTCSFHMIVVSLSYGSCICMYLNPSVKDTATFNKRVAILFYRILSYRILLSLLV